MADNDEAENRIESQQISEKEESVDTSDYSLDDLFGSDKEESLPLNDALEFVVKHRKILVYALIGVLLLSFILFLFLSPRFRVSKISIEGNYVLTDEEIINMIGVNYGDHIYKGVNGNILDIIRLDYGKTENSIISRYPYVEDIKIHAVFPSAVSVTVKERARVACIRLNDGFATVDTNGIVVELSLSNDGIERYNPVICGLEINHVMLGEKIEIADEDDYQKAVIILGAVLAADVNNTFADDYSFYESLREIRIIPSGMIYLTFKLPSETFLQVKLQSVESINDDMNWLVQRIRENAFDNLIDGALDMTGEEYIYRQY